MSGGSTDLFGRPLPTKLEFKASKVGVGAGRTRSVEDISAEVMHGDCLEVLDCLAEEGVQCDSCVTDPPYHLTSTVRRFRGSSVNGDSKIEQSAGDRSDSYGRLARGFMGQTWDGGDLAFRPEVWEKVSRVLRPGAFVLVFGGTRTFHRVVSAIEDAGLVIQDQLMWMYGEGFPKNKSMLKPAYEPICLAYKPGGARIRFGDDCRVGVIGGHQRERNDLENLKSGWRASGPSIPLNAGRWPANVCHDGSDEVVGLLPNSSSGPPADLSQFRASKFFSNLTGGTGGYGDEGSVARFFYTAKASEDDRLGSEHPTVKPIALMRWLVRLATPEGGTVLDPFAGTGSTGAAGIMEGVDSLLIEREESYVADIRRKLDHFRSKRARSLY